VGSENEKKEISRLEMKNFRGQMQEDEFGEQFWTVKKSKPLYLNMVVDTKFRDILKSEIIYQSFG
jgi:hypothetical protein